MLDALITSKTRIKLLLKFFLNSNYSAYLRSLEGEFGESTNAIRIELNRFEHAGLLTSSSSGNKKMFRANTEHPMFYDIQNILHKFIGIDQIVEKVIPKLGDISMVFVTGEFARGNDSSIIDLLIVSDVLDTDYLSRLIQKTEPMIHRQIRFRSIRPEAMLDDAFNNENKLLIFAR